MIRFTSLLLVMIFMTSCSQRLDLDVLLDNNAPFEISNMQLGKVHQIDSKTTLVFPDNNEHKKITDILNSNNDGWVSSSASYIGGILISQDGFIMRYFPSSHLAVLSFKKGGKSQQLTKKIERDALLSFLIENEGSQIEKIYLIDQMPYICEGEFIEGKSGCGSEHYWNLVRGKEGIIQILIENISNSDKIDAPVAVFGGQWTVGDISYTALKEIIQGIPTFELLGIKFDSEGCGYCSYWNHLRESDENREKFQKKISDWFIENQSKLEWEEGDVFSSCDCRGAHPNNGHFFVEEKE